MARETKVGLLIGVGLILLIAIIVNDVLVASKTAEEPPHLTTFAEATQDELAEPPGREATPTAAGPRDDAARHLTVEPTPHDAALRQDRLIPTAEELRSAEMQRREQRDLPPRSAQGLHAAMQIDAADQPGQLAPQQIRTERLTDADASRDALSPAQRAGLQRSAPPRQLIAPARDTSAEETAARSLRQDPPSQGQVIHYVAANEAMWDIADRYLGDGSKWKLIAAANPDQVDSRGRVNAGARLVIPTQTAVIAAQRQPEPREIDVTPRGGQVPTLYTVKAGDSLYKIAKSALGDGERYAEIAQLNGLTDANAITVGMKLKLPTADAPAGASTGIASATGNRPQDTQRTDASSRTYTVKAGDNLTRIARNTLGDGSRYAEIYAANRDVLQSEDDLKVGQVLKIPDNRSSGLDPTNPRTPIVQNDHGVTIGKKYTVQSGDTRTQIAQLTLGDADRWDEIAIMNQIDDRDRLQTGRVLFIPTPGDVVFW